MPEDKTIIIIIISFGALSISVFSLGWNFYRDVILKARVKVTISISNVYHGDDIRGPFVSIDVTNFGPGPITCDSIGMMKQSRLSFLGRHILEVFRMQTRYAHIMYDYTNPYSSELPKKLLVGERLTLLLSMNQDCLLAFDPTHVGVHDSFGRYHYATRRSLKKAKKEFFEKFEKKPWGT